MIDWPKVPQSMSRSVNQRREASRGNCSPSQLFLDSGQAPESSLSISVIGNQPVQEVVHEELAAIHRQRSTRRLDWNMGATTLHLLFLADPEIARYLSKHFATTALLINL